MNVGVIVFPGSNCDRDIAYVTRDLLQQPTRMIWHEDSDLGPVDLVVVPGGFSYGDYLRCGAIAQFSPALRATIAHAKRGGLVLGVCNGFQILTEAGLLPGALVRNRNLHFICDRLPLRIERSDLPWTQVYSTSADGSQKVITLPIAHGEGCYYADDDTLKALEDHNQVVFRYSAADGTLGDRYNPNGSAHSIAGICNRKGTVLGMMPHPERAADKVLGSADGLGLFQGVLTALASAA